MSDTGMNALSRQEAKGLLEEINGIQSTTRATRYAYSWQWQVVWSLTFLGAGVVVLVPAWQDFAHLYWLWALPLALLATAVVSVKIESRSPVRQRSLPYLIVGAAITVATTVMSFLLPEEAVVVVNWIILGFGFAALAWLERVLSAAWLLSGMALIAALLGLVVEDTIALYPVLALSFSAALAGIVAGMRIQSRK